jgi:hypothetical protein
MMQSRTAALCLFSSLVAMPILAQTTIGEGTCSSSTLTGNYAASLFGRAVTLPGGTQAGELSNVMVAVGTVNFDGLSKVTFSMSEDTNIATNTALSWSGTYSVQSNCVGSVNITTGDSATFNLAISLGGTGFVITGNDTTYALEGDGNTQATGCSNSTLSGVYVFDATQGFSSLTKSSAAGAGTISGLLQFDGQGNITADVSLSANALINGVTGTLPGLQATGTYTMGSNCVGHGTITNSVAGAFALNFSVYTANSTVDTQMYIIAATNPSEAMGLGNAFWIYALPSAPTGTAALAPSHDAAERTEQKRTAQKGSAL